MEIVDRFHGAGSGARARDAFIARFQQGALPEDMAEVTLHAGADGIGIANVLKAAGLVPSTSEAFRQLKQGAVKVDGARVEDGVAAGSRPAPRTCSRSASAGSRASPSSRNRGHSPVSGTEKENVRHFPRRFRLSSFAGKTAVSRGC